MSDIRTTGTKEKVQLEALHIRYIPVVTPMDIYEGDLSLINSPHVEMLEMYEKHGFDWRKLKKTRYVKERRRRFKIGMSKWTDGYILNVHLPKRFKLFESIRKKGYDRRQPIEILEEPFWVSRFGLKNAWVDGPEIWTGAGRAAARWVLGKRTIWAEWYEDRRPGSMDKGKFDKKLMFVKGVWNETHKK